MTEPDEPIVCAFLARDLRELATLGGLPDDLSLDRVAAALGADPDVMVRWFLGDPPEETFWCPATGIAGFDDTVKIWFRDGVVVKLTGERPDLDLADLTSLGPPDLLLDHRMGTLLVEGGERVWTSLGTAVKLNRSAGMVVEIAAFPRTTPAEYRIRLADVAEYRESPAPDG